MKNKPHGSVGSMPSGKAKQGRVATVDHPNMGTMPKGSAQYNPRCYANDAGKTGVMGGECKETPLPKEKDYSGYSRGK